MGLGALRGAMWAGIIEDHIATDTDKSHDEYTPITIALFRTKAEAKRHYERVIRVDVGKLLRVTKAKQG
jgi:hypothetical protein